MLKGLAVFLCLSLSLFVHASSKPHRKPSEPRPQVDQFAFAPFWTAEPGWHSELQLRNNTDDHITVLPTLNLSTAGSVDLSPLVLAPNDTQTVDLSAALTNVVPKIVGRVGSFGSVSVYYKAAGITNVYASVMVHKEGSPIAFHIDANPAVADFISGSYESIWWKPTASAQDWLILSNPSKRSIAGKILISDASGKEAQSPFAIPPGRAQRIDVTDLLAQNRLSGDFGGLSIVPNQDHGFLQITHLAIDESAGVSALLKTFGRSVFETKDFSIRAPMVALNVPDPALSLPADLRLYAKVFLFNASENPIKVEPLVDWRDASTWGRLPLGTLQIGPRQTVALDLSALQTDQHLIPLDAHWATVQLRYQADNGDLVALAASTSSDGRTVVQSPFSEGLSFQWKGGQWDASPNHTALIVAGNAGTKPAKLDFKIRHTGGRGLYEFPIRYLQPGETFTINIADVIRSQSPDRNGKTIPLSVTTGSYEFSDLDDRVAGYLYEGKQSIDQKFGLSTYGCAKCCYYDDQWIADFFSPAGGSGGIPGYGDSDCQGTYSIVDITSSITNWLSANTGIATVSPGTANGVAGGSTYSQGDVTLRGYQSYLQCPLRPQNPSGALEVLAVTINSADIIQDQVSITLSPNTLSGHLSVVAQGSGGNLVLFDGTANSGTSTYSFKRTSLPIGQYSSVNATWTVQTTSASGSAPVAFNVMGVYRHSQYNTPNENSCVGAASGGYITNSSCAFSAATFKSDFITQSWLNGSGITVNYGKEQNEAFCMTHGSPPQDADGKSFRPTSVIYGKVDGVDYPVSDSTVARGDGADLLGGDAVLIVGLGAGGQTVKTVADRCPACTGYLQLDNYTTQSSCQIGAIPDLGNFTTIRLR